MKTIKQHLEDTEETLNKQFPKGKCKERGNALVLFAIFNMAMENYKKDVLKLIKSKKQTCYGISAMQILDELEEEIKGR